MCIRCMCMRRLCRAVVLCGLGLGLVFAVGGMPGLPLRAAPAATIYVNGASGNDANNCTAPATACKTVGAALGKANPGDTIQIAAGVYAESVEVDKDVTLTGAGIASTFLDGGGVRRVLVTRASVNINQLTVRNGAILTDSASLFDASGAGIFNTGDLTLQNVRVMNNTAQNSGGGIFNMDMVIMTDTQIISNTAVAGGGIYNYNLGQLSAERSLFEGNQALQGGAIAEGRPVTLRDSTLRHNRGGQWGGALTLTGGRFTVERSVLYGNTTDGPGGAIYAQIGAITITNSTLSDNLAQSGGAIFGATVSMTIHNSTLAGNRTSTGANGTSGIFASSADTLIRNTIVAGANGRNCTTSGTWTSLGNNLSSDTRCDFTQGGDQQNTDPLLGELNTYGTTTWFHPLLPGSPAIDAGSNSGCPARDQRNITRPVDGDGDTTAVCDIGAIEAINQVVVADASVTEGNSGTVTLGFTLTLSPPASQAVTVNYTTADGSARAGSDYVTASGSVVFAPGQTSKVVQVTVNGDANDETDETLTFRLTSAQNADIIDGQATGTIVDDDGLSALTIADTRAVEGNSGRVTLVFDVTLSPATGNTVQVDYATADSSATAGSDYTATSGTLVFLAGETAKTISVFAAGDSIDEFDESFIVRLSNANGATLTDDSGTGVIEDDDAAQVTLGPGPEVPEGDSGTNVAQFQVLLTRATGFTVTVDYATQDGPVQGGARAGSDYVQSTGTVTFAPGQTSRTISVPIMGDTEAEGDERFSFRLSNPAPISLVANSSSATILDDDASNNTFSTYLPMTQR